MSDEEGRVGARARAVMLGVDCVDPWTPGAHCLGSVIRQGKEGKEGKREKLGRWGKGLLDYAFPAEPAPCRSLTPWGQLGKRRGRGQRVKAVAVGGTERVRRVLQATAELLCCTGWNAVVDMVAASFLRSPLLMTTL